MESFFALLQKNVLDQHSWATRQQLRLAIVTWIEATYHRRRRQRVRLNRPGFGSVSFGRMDHAPSVSTGVPAACAQDA
jgi:hypothetical protein